MIYSLKIFSTLFLWILIVLSLGLTLTRNVRKNGLKEKCGWYLSFTAAIILFLFSTKPVSNLLVYSLERDYQLPSKEVLLNLDAIVILAGGVRHSDVLPGGTEAVGVTYSRLFSGVHIFKENNAKLLVVQGTSRVDMESDSVVMAELAEQLGVPRNRIIIEANSRNTLEHAVELRKIFPATKKMRIGIITSAMHMRRSGMAFRRKFPEDVIVLIPVDCRYSVLKYDIENFIPSAEAFVTSNDALRELVGMVWYLLIHEKA